MIKIHSQRGSSTTGLLTASAIYVGLLAYAHFYAFNGQDDNAVVQQEDTLEQENQPVAELPSTDIVAPTGKGIFQSETIAVNTETASTHDVVQEKSDTQQETVTRSEYATRDLSELKANQEHDRTALSNTMQSAEPDATTSRTATNEAYTSTVYPSYQDYRIAGPLNAGDEVIMLDGKNRLAGDANYHQYLESYQRARGDGQGRGQMDGDGEFDFSMTFKSRARMDADTDWDGDFATQGRGSHYGNYLYDAAAYPTYQTYYYSQY